MAAVAAHGFRQLRTTFEEAAAAAPENQMLALGQGYLRFASAHPGLFRLMFGSGLDRQSHPELEQAAQDALEFCNVRPSIEYLHRLATRPLARGLSSTAFLT